MSLFLLAVGGILAFAVADTLEGVDLETVGWILMAVGAIGVVLSLVFWSSWGGAGSRRTTVREERRDELPR